MDMEGQLNLIKTGYQDVEKRIFPRFPFCFLTFKGDAHKAHAFEVVDISYTGMQLGLKSGGHTYTEGQDLKGAVHWKGRSLDVSGKVKWVSGQRLGVKFKQDVKLEENIKNFLTIDNIVKSMRPVHGHDIDMDVPSNLKYWVRADGPFEIFVWRHNDGEIARFQVIMMENYVEWHDGKGIKTGRVISKRDMDTPLILEDEIMFRVDEGVDGHKVSMANEIVTALGDGHLPTGAREFLTLKLS
ncbi:MAG: hypothetical protein CME71_06730 [Halobacteriovorax sp.]|nr:hypothetical protein [Halobacteriovorax sp.]